MAVKTPKELLSKSAALAEKHQSLESKVLNMEVEIVSLEEKYQSLVRRYCFCFSPVSCDIVFSCGHQDSTVSVFVVSFEQVILSKSCCLFFLQGICVHRSFLAPGSFTV